VEGFGNYRSGVHWQGRQANFLTYTFALRQQLFGGKASLGLVAVNAFGNYLTQHSTVEGVGFVTDNRLEIPYRSFGINLLCKFGRVKISKPKEDENFLPSHRLKIESMGRPEVGPYSYRNLTSSQIFSKVSVLIAFRVTC